MSYKICPNCKKINDKNSEVCKYCGFSLKDYKNSTDEIKDNLKNIENITISKSELEDCKTYYDLLSKCCIDRLFSSKSELKRAISNNSVSVNKKKITSENEEFIKEDIFSYEFMLVQNGKKNYFVVFFTN